MSYDMSIDDENFNYTYNVAGMWYSAVPDAGIRVIYGLSGKDAAPLLRGIWNHMVENHIEMRKMEPNNGWGSFDGALGFINDLVMASLRNPESIWDGD